MKKIFIIILAIFNLNICFGQLKSQVDERFELTSIAFRIAGVPEYKNGRMTDYNKDVDEYFGEYKTHLLRDYIVTLRNEYRLGYSAVAGSASFISIIDGRVVANPSISISQLPGIGDVWTEETFNQYVTLLDDFYQDSDFNSFFENHKDVYTQAEKSFDEILIHVDTEWFSTFFEADFKAPNIYLAMCNGPHHYYIQDFDAESGYSIVIGANQTYFIENILPTIIHEICHNYSNPLFYQYWSEMEDSANIIFNYIKDDMATIAYGNAQTSILEWQNDLFSTLYFKSIPPIFNYILAENRDRGFIWLPHSIQFMENFYDNQERYTKIDLFMPQLVSFLNYTAHNFEEIVKEYQTRNPYVVSVYPANGSTIDNLIDISEIKITFSKPMSTGCYNIDVIETDSDIYRIPRSKTNNAYWKDEYTFIIPIDYSKIEKNKKYGLALRSGGFMTDDYNNLLKDYEIYYKTK